MSAPNFPVLIFVFIYDSDTNGWGLLNSATDVLWHKKKPTLASYNQNATITDGLINAICA